MPQEIQAELRQKKYGPVKITWLDCKPSGFKVQIWKRSFKIVWEYRRETS
jgi:hypothetical protein